MKEIIIDGVEYILIQKEKATLEVEDKYAKIREVVSRFSKNIFIYGDKRELVSYESGNMLLTEKKHFSGEELHFEECTLGDLKENDVFVFEEENNVYILGRIEYQTAGLTNPKYWLYYIKDDFIRTEWYVTDNLPVIKILRD